MRGVEVNSGTYGSYETARFAPKNKNHTIVKGRTFPEKLIEADIRQKPTDPAVRMIVTETKLKEMQNNKPSLKADIIQEANIEHEKQQLIIKESNGAEKRMSAEELIKQPGDASLSLSRSGNLPATPASDSFVMPPYKYNANKVLGSVSFFIFDHLGSSRVVYKPNVNCNGGAVSFSLENVVDYYPYGKVLREYRAGIQEKYLFTGKERDMETGWDYFGARFRDSDAIPFTTIDKLAPEFPAWSPYNYGKCNPINRIDPDGNGDTDFKDKDGNTISHVEDGSNAVFQLKGTNQTNESFEFTGYNNQGGKNEVSVEGAITGAQDYVTNNYTKCNQSVNFVGRTYESAVKAQGKTVDNIGIVNGNSLAREITSNLKSKVTAETSVAAAQESAAKGNLVVGANGGHVVTMTTKTFDITRYNTSGSIIEKKQIIGGKTTNVNGSFRATNIGPGQLNSFQNPNYSGMKWYSLPAK